MSELNLGPAWQGLSQKSVNQEQNEQHKLMVQECMESSALTDWEEEFLTSLEDRLGSGGALSSYQLQKLLQVWEERTL